MEKLKIHNLAYNELSNETFFCHFPTLLSVAADGKD